MKELFIGYDEKGSKVYLTIQDLLTHVHLCGLTRGGKSKLLEWICRLLLHYGFAFLSLDPHGSLYRALLAYIAAYGYTRKVALFDPSYDKRIVGYNPFMTDYTDEARIMTKAERLTQATLKVFGLESSDQFGNIERWLRAIYYAVLELELSICDIKYFLYFEYKSEREQLIKLLRSETIKADLIESYSWGKEVFKKDLGSTRNKLQRFTHPHMRRIIGLRQNNIEMSTIVENGFTLLCNLQPASDDLVGRDNLRALGTLMVSDLWEVFKKLKKPKEFYLIIDEMTEYMTPDLAQMLPRSAGYGLHCFLAHQDRGQLTPAIESAIKNAQTKIFFSTEDNPMEQRCFLFRRANHETMICEAPYVQSTRVSQARIEKVVEYLTQYFLTSDQVDRLLSAPQKELEPPKDLDPYE